ncbi:GDSL-type esterase/lipase family protein [Pedobacter hartonius]|uniref:GDSL-like Lipase/Acylhydrolase family protein n=1 Tax=Pedobacter hartonius TaxID=425514 RepID=A0A1H3XHZ7_9SPHI|nr:GDSL-type esterase/lipase family protein [Pedobacter hartonius]SDZ98188.1 GDSL-like Lipase/Acylhydrolase family protein [Pedobacter hartonius]
MNKNKLIWFKVLALLLPVVILCLAELMLRLFNYGHTTALFVKDPDDQSCMVMNPYASAKFFSDSVNATKGNHEQFKIVKAPGTFRIFVLGESTTVGYPYMHNGSFHRWLQYRLMHTFPDRNFEVVNVSLTAVNSYTVLDFARQTIPYHPDAVLIYTGHNEYYGALGTGSTSRIAGKPFWINTVVTLRGLRLVQLIENAVQGVQKVFGGAHTDTRDNLMKRMAASQEIANGSADYRQGITQFNQNMTEVCRLLSAQHIPVFLSTLVSNEKDLKPFISASGPRSANEFYQLANTAYAKGDYKSAKSQYIQAKESDLLRFRAPEAMNAAIKKIATQFPGVYLTDSRSLFERYSPHGILGKETLLEHVHPNLLGYALLSDAFYQEMKRSHLLRPGAGMEMSFAQLLKQMPLTRVDSLYGAWQIMMLKTGWPFNIPIPKDFKRGGGMDEKIAGALAVDRISWADAMDNLFRYSLKINDKAMALKITEALILENPYHVPYYLYAGRLSFETQNFNHGLLYFKKAWMLEPSEANLQNLYLLCLKADHPEEALVYLNKLAAGNTSGQGIDRAVSMIRDIIRLKQQGALMPDSSKNRIAWNYRQLNAQEAAVKYEDR